MIKFCGKIILRRRSGRGPAEPDFRCREYFLAARAFVAMRSCAENLIHLPLNALLRLIVLLLALSPSVAVGANGPRGIYLYPYPYSLRNGDWDRAMAVPGVNGTAVVLNWAELSASGQVKAYDFAELDRRLALARARKLAVELVILAGRGVPAWVFAAPPAGLGLKRLDFVYSHHDGAGPCVPVAMPPPWEVGYLNAFAEMLERTAQHLRANGAMDDVTVVKLTGLNTETEELRLPAQTPWETGKSCVTDAVTTWRDAGYRPALISQAMTQLAAAFARAFPDKWVTLPVILANGFPPINDQGQALPRGKARGINNALLDGLVRAATTALPGRFIVQLDFLIADQPAAPRAVELARTNGLPIAWQTNLFYGGQGRGAACGGKFGQATPCDAASYLALLERGIHPAGGAGASAQARYIEVFPFDALTFSTAIGSAHTALTR